MSKPWKGWMSEHSLGLSTSGYIYRGCHIPTCQPVIVTPIDDESLPHPGDGRIWEDKYGTAHEILTAPLRCDGKWRAYTRRTDNNSVADQDLSYLRERKPEPAHRPHCPLSKPLLSGYCRCERRSPNRNHPDARLVSDRLGLSVGDRMKTIWWYQADPAEGWQEVEMPKGARPLHYEGGSPGHGRFWAEVDPDAPVVATLVGIWGTGWNIPDNAVHVSTHIGPTGYVWHLYREPTP